MLSKDKDKEPEKPAYTGTASPLSATTVDPIPAGVPPEADMVFARAAASEALSRGGKDVSVPWENPRTGARGSVTPLASIYTRDGIPCRAFLVSYVHEANEAWLEGEACHVQDARWDIRNLKPWKRP
jgi:17 kDa outer membrane surface antigen